jgi:GntR family transcriptional regulator
MVECLMVNKTTTVPSPAYRFIANELREAILQNRFPQGHQLPTEDELAKKYGLGRQTIRRAFQDLAAEGLIYRIRRRGTFAYPVTAPLTNSFGHVGDIGAFSTDDETEIIEPLRVVEDDANVDELLQLAGAIPGSLVIRRVQRSKPLYFASLRFPPAVTELLAAERALAEPGHRGRFTIIGLIDRQWSEPILTLTETFGAVAATKEVAQHLDCPPRTPVMRVERIYYDRVGLPVELATTFYHPSNYILRSRMRR